MRGAEHYFNVPPSPCMVLDCPLTSLCGAELLACEKFHAWVTVSNQIPKRSQWEKKCGEPESRFYELLFSEIIYGGAGRKGCLYPLHFFNLP